MTSPCATSTAMGVKSTGISFERLRIGRQPGHHTHAGPPGARLGQMVARQFRKQLGLRFRASDLRPELASRLRGWLLYGRCQ